MNNIVENLYLYIFYEQFNTLIKNNNTNRILKNVKGKKITRLVRPFILKIKDEYKKYEIVYCLINKNPYKYYYVLYDLTNEKINIMFCIIFDLKKLFK